MVVACGTGCETDTNLNIWSEDGGFISESGILFVSKDIEELILNEIRKTKAKKQRANTDSSTRELLKEYDLP